MSGMEGFLTDQEVMAEDFGDDPDSSVRRPCASSLPPFSTLIFKFGHCDCGTELKLLCDAAVGTIDNIVTNHDGTLCALSEITCNKSIFLSSWLLAAF